MKQETLEEASEKRFNHNDNKLSVYQKIAFCEGANWRQKISYSEEEVLELLNDCRGENPIDVSKWFEQFKNK